MKTLLASGIFEGSNFEIYRESGRLFFDPGNSARVDLCENKAVLALLECCAKVERGQHRALTVMLLRVRYEVFMRMGGMGEKTFTREFLGGLGAYERKIAKEESIQL